MAAMEDSKALIAKGAHAVSWGRSVGTHPGEFLGILPTGRTLNLPTAGMLRFENGQVVERWGITDDLAMMRQLGILGLTTCV